MSGAGWPASTLINATVCGNNFLNGSEDCNPDSSGQVTSRPDGSFIILLTVEEPPKPCPCVVHVANALDSGTVDIPFEVIGAPTATPTRTIQTRSVNVEARLDGTGPLSAYFGGQAQRQLLVTVQNTGNVRLESPQLNLTFGKGQDPTEPIVTANGQTPTLGPIEPGAVAEIRQTVIIEAPAFGTYRLKGQFIGLDSITVDGELQPAGQLTFTTTTSTYPWGLILVGWLLLQIPLLGLYKRRPVVVEQPPTPAPVEYAPDYTYAGPAVEAGFAAGVFDAAPPMAGTIPPSGVTALPPPPSGFRVVGAVPPPPPAPPVPPLPQPGLPGVNDLRSLLDG